MKIVFSILILISLIIPLSANAQNSKNSNKYYKSEVIKIISEKENDGFNIKSKTQTIEVKLLEGDNSGKIIKIENSSDAKVFEAKKVKAGDQIIVLESNQTGKILYTVWDKFRLNMLLFFLIGFFILVIFIAGIKGVGSILGLGVSLVIILGWIVPQILNGRDPVLISISGALVIMVTTIFLAHGFSKRTLTALIATFISLFLTGIFAYLAVNLLSLSGSGDETAYMLQYGSVNINIKGLLLGGIIIGTLGVLDDITTSQSAAIFEIHKANTKLDIWELIYRGYTVGKEHVASLVNTLVLAYAGASLSIFILFILNPNNVPVWVILNSEIITEEIARTIAGSIGIILAVPITTLLAAYLAPKKLFNNLK